MDMAVLYRAQIVPSKLEFIAAWVPLQPWFAGEGEFENIGAYRFDDPAGEVGIETILVRAGDGPVLQVPVTYRGAPLAGAESALITTMDHSVLGPRWVYDATMDPCYLDAVIGSALTGSDQAPEFVAVDGELIPRAPTAVVHGTGAGVTVLPGEISPVPLSTRFVDGETVIETSTTRVVVVRNLQNSCAESSRPATRSDGSERIIGTWAGQPEPRILVWVFPL